MNGVPLGVLEVEVVDLCAFGYDVCNIMGSVDVYNILKWSLYHKC